MWHKKIKILSNLACLLISLSLVGCVSLRVAQQTTYTRQSHQLQIAKRQAIQHWNIQGAFSIQQPGTKPILANYTWQQKSAKHFTLQISAPLRAVVVTIQATPQQATLTQAGKPQIKARTIALLIKQQLNAQLHIPLPIAQLYWWLPCTARQRRL